MKKILSLFIVLTLFTGCAQLQQFQDTVSITTKSYTNPVTREDLDGYEAGMQAAFALLKAYKRSCVEGLADKNCRANIKAIQVYTVQIPPMLTSIRGFVDSGDQINAITVYNSLVKLIGDLKNAAVQRGVNLGTTL